MSLRVLMLSWEYPPHWVGGLGKHVAGLLPELANEGLEIHLITPLLQGGEPVEEITPPGSLVRAIIHRVEPPQPFPNDFFSVAWQTNRKLYACAVEIIKHYGPFNVVHAHDWLVAFASEQIKTEHKIPLVATIHATERGRGRGSLVGELPRAIHNVEWWLTYEAWRVICCSNYMVSEITDYFDAPTDKIDIVPNGVDVKSFDHLDGTDLDSFRAKYATPTEKIVFFVGRIVEEKGVRTLIDCAPTVLASAPQAKFVIAGTGPQLVEYQNLVIERGLTDHFHFTGFIADDTRDKLYKVANVAVFPSLYEPFGIVALEAMAAKVPVVVADTGGLKEVVINHQNGIVVHPNNPQSLAWGITHSLENEEWAAARVRNAYLSVCEYYTWRHVARQTIAVYQRIYAEFLASEWANPAHSS